MSKKKGLKLPRTENQPLKHQGTVTTLLGVAILGIALVTQMEGKETVSAVLLMTQ